MIKTLVSLDNNLASSIALKYACQLANMIGMDLLPIHVESSEPERQPPGTGWVQQTWEKGVLETAQEQISRMLAAEKASCRALGAPKITVGDREDVILQELSEGAYDLYIEGALYAFNPSSFYEKTRSKLYVETPCPIILVKNLVRLKKLGLLLEDEEKSLTLISEFLKIFEGAEVQIDLIHFRFQKDEQLKFKEGDKGDDKWDRKKSDDFLRAAETMLEEKGRPPKECRMVHDSPTNIADSLEDYGLVVSHTPYHPSKKSPHVELLNRVPSAILLYRR
jgi:hypothetical protein